MSRLMVFGFLAGVLLPGCRVESYEGGGDPLDDGATGCTSGQHPTQPTDPASPSSPADPVECKAHTDCAAGSFCLLGSGQCTPATSCELEADCLTGFNCDLASKSCLPASDPTCGEMADEATCVVRKDCAPTYAGVDCTCGPDCKCVGGEPGCVCGSFEFFRCEPVAL